MRSLPALAALITSFGIAWTAQAGGPGEPVPAAGYSDFGGYCDACDPCGHGHGRHCGHCGHICRRHLWYQQNSVFSCGCRGSYKHPVPPLYTYHWPGMYSAERMTDYVSPWRFPPLKPYTDELGIEVQHAGDSPNRIQPASAILENAAAKPASFSDHLERSLR